MSKKLVWACAASLCIAPGPVASAAAQVQSSGSNASAGSLPVTVTEEGQHVAMDRYTWTNRQLAKRLPLTKRWPQPEAMARTSATLGLSPAPVPATLPVPARIIGDVYLVSSDPTLTYLVDAGPEGLVLIDPGLSRNFDAICSAITKLGFSPKRVRWVLNTHAHFDHSMADGPFRRQGASILVGVADADAVERATRVTAKFFDPSIERDYPTTTVDRRIVDGEELRLGNKTIHAISTPGHTAGSTAFYMIADGRNVLFSGDTVLFDSRLGTQDTAYANNRDYLESLRKLSRFTMSLGNVVRWDLLLPGHGAIVLDRAGMDVDKAFDTVRLDMLEGGRIEAAPFATDRYRRLMFGRP